MRERVNEFSDRYQHNFSILATPAEGLSGKFTARDRKAFGEIPGVTDKIYYTNSNHVPVYYHCSPRHKAKIEAPYHELTRGGHIFYVDSVLEAECEWFGGGVARKVERCQRIFRRVERVAPPLAVGGAI